MLDDSLSNLITSSTSRSISIDNIRDELGSIYQQLGDISPKMESLASFSSVHGNIKQELKSIITT